MQTFICTNRTFFYSLWAFQLKAHDVQ